MRPCRLVWPMNGASGCRSALSRRRAVDAVSTSRLPSTTLSVRATAFLEAPTSYSVAAYENPHARWDPDEQEAHASGITFEGSSLSEGRGRLNLFVALLHRAMGLEV